MRLARNVVTKDKAGMCGLTAGPAYAYKAKGKAPPLPPPAMPPRPPPPPVTHYGDPGGEPARLHPTAPARLNAHTDGAVMQRAAAWPTRSWARSRG